MTQRNSRTPRENEAAEAKGASGEAPSVTRGKALRAARLLTQPLRPCPLATHSHAGQEALPSMPHVQSDRERACCPDAGRYRPHTAVGVSKSHQAVVSRADRADFRAPAGSQLQAKTLLH